jgi:hypothetical protein
MSCQVIKTVQSTHKTHHFLNGKYKYSWSGLSSLSSPLVKRLSFNKTSLEINQSNRNSYTRLCNDSIPNFWIFNFSCFRGFAWLYLARILGTKWLTTALLVFDSNISYQAVFYVASLWLTKLVSIIGRRNFNFFLQIPNSTRWSTRWPTFGKIKSWITKVCGSNRAIDLNLRIIDKNTWWMVINA